MRGRRVSHRRDGERGSTPVTVVMIMAVLALLCAISITAVLSAAGDERSTAQHAADAAALAGAQGVLDGVPDDLAYGFADPSAIPLLLGGGVCVQRGRADAVRLAQANGAALTSYCYDVWDDTVRVAVRLTDTRVGSGLATADAEAATTFDASRCTLAGDFTRPPTQTPSPPPDPGDPDDDDATPTAPPPPPPPTSVDTTIDCGFGDLAVVFRTSDLRFHFVGLSAALDDLEPKLTK